MSILLEGCVDSVASALAAERGGALRLELCANLDVGGTTPGEALVADVMAAVRIPIIAMARPRGGDFVHTPEEIASIRADVRRLRLSGVQGVVFGILRADHSIHAEATRALVAEAEGTEAVVHRAFDHAADLERAFETLMECGVVRVLTGGGPGPAVDGVAMLRRLVARGGTSLEVLAGGKVRPGNVTAVVAGSGVRQVHARCGEDERMVRAMVQELASTASRTSGGA